MGSGVKKIAMVVATIVVIGVVMQFLTDGFLTDEVITPVWEWMWDQIQNFFT